jgi:hypothetical protein
MEDFVIGSTRRRWGILKKILTTSFGGASIIIDVQVKDKSYIVFMQSSRLFVDKTPRSNPFLCNAVWYSVRARKG